MNLGTTRVVLRWEDFQLLLAYFLFLLNISDE